MRGVTGPPGGERLGRLIAVGNRMRVLAGEAAFGAALRRIVGLAGLHISSNRPTRGALLGLPAAWLPQVSAHVAAAPD